MDSTLFNSYLVEDKSYVSFIKREIHHLVAPAFTESRTGEIDIVVSELISNLTKYAGGGELLYRLDKEGDEPVFEFLCIDNGPGIRNLSHYMKDGMSSSTSLGHGIGSVNRLSSLAQFYSMEDWGTIVYCRFLRADYKRVKSKMLLRYLKVAKPGEVACGDGIAVRELHGKTLLFTGDGLGHGDQAKIAVDKAIATFHASHTDNPADIIKMIDKEVKKTRGLVATVAVMDDRYNKWEMCGVGNISTRLYQGLEYKSYICHNGIIGMNIPTRIETAVMPMEKLQQLILCSDGIRTKWDLIRYSSILKYDPMILAAVIYKDHARRTDDMTILVAKAL